MSDRHCYRCTLAPPDECAIDTAKLDTIDATFAEDGEEVSFVGGYGAREIARRRAADQGSRVFVNDGLARMRRPGSNLLAEFAVSRADVYTLRPPDDRHATVYRAYWRPL